MLARTGANAALQNLDLTLNQQGAGVRSDSIPAQPWVSSAHIRAVVRDWNLTQERELALGALWARDTGCAARHLRVPEHLSDPVRAPIFLSLSRLLACTLLSPQASQANVLSIFVMLPGY